VELITDLNNDGKITSADNTLLSAAYKTGATDEEKEKGTEYIFSNDQISNGAWDKEDNTTPGKPTSAKDDDDAKEIKLNIATTFGEVWFEHPAIDAMTFYKTKECNASEKIDIKTSAKFQISATHPLPEKLFVRVDGALNLPEASPEQLGELKLMLKISNSSQSIEAAKIFFTVVQKMGAKHVTQAIQDYILEKNVSCYYGVLTYPNGADSVYYAAMLKKQTSLIGINARTLTAKGIDEVAQQVPWKNQTIIINASYNYVPPGSSEEDSEGFYVSHRGELFSGGSWDTSCSQKASVIDPANPWKHISSTAPGIFSNGAGGDMPTGASDGSGGLTNEIDGVRWTAVADSKFNTEDHLLFIGSSENKETVNKFAADLIWASSNGGLEWIQCDGGASIGMAVANPNGQLNTVVAAERHHTAYMLLPRIAWLKTYLGFKAIKPRP
jgi:hypothetical protein